MVSNLASVLRSGRPSAERGAVLPMLAIIVVVLVGAAAMAVDLGWLYWQSIEVQHGADAAALAGVIYEPDQRAQAHAAGIAAAAENGYIDTSMDGSDVVEIIDFIDDPTAVPRNNQLRASVTHKVPTFFLKVFGSIPWKSSGPRWPSTTSRSSSAARRPISEQTRTET
jgi:Flp pilus assembly protein TadG